MRVHLITITSMHVGQETLKKDTRRFIPHLITKSKVNNTESNIDYDQEADFSWNKKFEIGNILGAETVILVIRKI